MKLAMDLARGLANCGDFRARLMASPGATLGLQPTDAIVIDQLYLAGHRASRWGQKISLFAHLFLRKEKEVDLYHFSFIMSPTTARFAQLLSAIKQKPSIITVFGTTHLDDMELAKSFRTDWTVYFSNYTKERLQKAGVRNIVRILPGINTEHFHTCVNTEGRRSFGFDDQHVVGLFPAQATYGLGIDIVVDCLAMLVLRYPQIRMIFACRSLPGSRARQIEIQTKLAERGLSRYVRCVGTVPDMAALYRSCDFVLYPARDLEGKMEWPLSILEAAACGLPTFASDLAYLRELVDGYGLGKCCSCHDIDILTNMVAEWIESGGKRASLSRHCADTVRREFSFTRMLSAYRQLYSGILCNAAVKDEY